MHLNYLSCLSPNCGIGRYTSSIAATMHQKGHSVRLLRKEGSEKLPYEWNYPYRSFGGYRHLVAPIFLAKALKKLPHQNAIWHADNIDAFSALVWSGIAKGQPKIVTIHDTIPLWYPAARWAERKAYHYHLKKAAQQADAVVTVSENSASDLIQYTTIPPEKIHVIYNGIDHQRLFPQVTEKTSRPFTIRYIGGLGAPHKNAVALIETARILENRKMDFVLEIGSGNAYLTGLTKLASNYQLKNVRFCGYLPDEELASFLSGADLFLYPSLYEGFGFPPLEAMACGTPVLAANIPIMQEILGDAADLVTPTPTHFADAIMRFSFARFSSPLREKGLKKAQEYSWEKTTKQLHELYRRVSAENTTASAMKAIV